MDEEQQHEEITIDAKEWPPIPSEELAKGSTITPERLIDLGAITGADPGSAEWSFRLLALRDEIMMRSKHKGSPLSVRIHKNGIHINTDSEASDYHDRRAGHGVQQVFWQVSALNHLVDVSALSSVEQQRHDRSLCLWGAKTSALKRATKLIESTTNTESTNTP